MQLRIMIDNRDAVGATTQGRPSEVEVTGYVSTALQAHEFLDTALKTVWGKNA